MSGANIEQDRLQFDPGVERLKEEVAVLEARFAELNRQNSRASLLLRKLGRYLGFGAAGKLDWARFKLRLKQKELDYYEARDGTPEIIA
jgi:hypothetical protein